MAAKKTDMAACPHCGEMIRCDATACPHCGSDERTGWSDSTYLDEVDLPADDDEYEEILESEFGTAPANKKPWWRSWLFIAAVIVIIAFLAGYIRTLF
jgi:hypothetical protein